MTKNLLKHSYGYIPDQRDHNDHVYSASLEHLQTLPDSVDMRSQCCPIMDQGNLGSCTSHAITAALRFVMMKQGMQDLELSRLAIYYGEREKEGTIDSDAGAMIRDGMKVVNSQGAGPESDWLYDISKFRDKPTAQYYKDALLDRAISYQRVTRSLDQMRACLASGYPFVFGFSVYESFETQQVAETGHVFMPRRGERLLGGHAVMCCGYNDIAQAFYVQNSWGDSWGMKGFFTLPYTYLINSSLSSDFWTIRMIGK